ncbi:hypothetical protein GCM10011380_27910 [Sphingomonas metalli]|uniref:Uncharacterized protein n=1 Tax=Sphingomonas metalli TaxID=1779358 RepID=A0A916T9T5_9SPHN|nr:hypothetical protein [Sphingomonas metalli]GGB36939.1 hypothetical protein GCM10011380_27910 [Sphingomonas metalli]
MVLRHLPGSGEGRDRQAHAHDPAEQAITIIGGRVFHAPGFVALRLVPVGQRGDMGAEPIGIALDREVATRFDHDIVPGRDGTAVDPFGRVPAGMQIGVRTLEDGERGPAPLRDPPEGVCERDMPFQPRRAVIGEQRQVHRLDPAVRIGRDQRREGDVAHRRGEHRRPLLAELARRVHRSFRQAMAARSSSTPTKAKPIELSAMP